MADFRNRRAPKGSSASEEAAKKAAKAKKALNKDVKKMGGQLGKVARGIKDRHKRLKDI